MNESSSSHEERLSTGSLSSGNRDETRLSAFKDGYKLKPPGVTELNLSQMAKRREQTQTQAAQAAQELERLRGQREELERERQRLETLEQRQVKYEQEHQNLREGLTQRMELLRKMDLQASRRAELFAVVRRRYEEMLQEVERIRDQSWPDERYDEELNRALAIMEDIEREYNRAWSRVEAVAQDAVASPPATAGEPSAMHSPAPALIPRRFSEWVWVGMAFSLPLIVAMLALLALARWLWGIGG